MQNLQLKSSIDVTTPEDRPQPNSNFTKWYFSIEWWNKGRGSFNMELYQKYLEVKLSASIHSK